MNDIRSLRKSLSQLFIDIKTGSISIAQASEMNNAAGKIIGTLNTELQYLTITGDEMGAKKKRIRFLEYDDTE